MNNESTYKNFRDSLHQDPPFPRYPGPTPSRIVQPHRRPAVARSSAPPCRTSALGTGMWTTAVASGPASDPRDNMLGLGGISGVANPLAIKYGFTVTAVGVGADYFNT